MDAVSYLLGKQSSGGGGTPNLQDKSVIITQNGNINVSADTGYDGLNSVGITTSVQPVLETKSVTITTNTTTTITPTAGKDGLSSVEVITNVAGGGGLNWSAIGYSSEPQHVTDTYNEINSDYNYSKNILDSWDATQTNLNAKFQNNKDLKYMPLVDTSNAINLQSTFNGCSNLYNVPLLNTSNVTAFYRSFKGCSVLTEIPQFNTQNVMDFYQAFMSCSALTTVPILNTSKVAGNNSLQGVFANCANLTDTSLDNILQMCINATSYGGTKTLSQLGLVSTYYPVSRIEALPHYQDFINAGWTIGY